MFELGKPNETAMQRNACQKNFYFFVQEMWHEIVHVKADWNWHIEMICRELQTVAERVFRGEPSEYDLIVNVPPGTSKSTVCSVMFPAWVWTRMPEAQIMCLSYGSKLSEELSDKCRDVVQSPTYRRMFPEIQLRQGANTKTHYKTNFGGWRFATSLYGAATGMHAHFLMMDDPVDPSLAMSRNALANANHWINNTFLNRKVRLDLTPTTLVQQRIDVDDTTGNWLKKELPEGTLRHICLPADISGGAAVLPADWQKFYKDGLLAPRRLPRKSLQKIRADIGGYAYAGQYDQQPIMLFGGMFETRKIVIESGYPNIIAKVRAWDKSASAGMGDYTVGALLGLDDRGQVWILDIVRGQWDTGTREDIMLQTACADGPDVDIILEIEGAAGGKDSWVMTTKNLIGFNVKGVRPTTNKVRRADTFSVQVNIGNVKMVAGEWNRACLEEMQHFPGGHNDDIVDALSMAFSGLSQTTTAESETSPML